MTILSEKCRRDIVNWTPIPGYSCRRCGAVAREHLPTGMWGCHPCQLATFHRMAGFVRDADEPVIPENYFVDGAGIKQRG